MNVDERDSCDICGYYYVGLANDCKCTGNESGGMRMSDEPLTDMVMSWDRAVRRGLDWLKAEDTYPRWQQLGLGLICGITSAAFYSFLKWLGG